MFGKIPVDISKNIIAREMTIEVLRSCLSLNNAFRPSVISEIFQRRYFEAIELQCKLLIFWASQNKTISPDLKAIAQKNFYLYAHYIILFQDNNKDLAYQLIQNLAVIVGLLSESYVNKFKQPPFLSYAQSRQYFKAHLPNTFEKRDEYNPLINMSVSISHDPLLCFAFPEVPEEKNPDRARIVGNYAFNQSSPDNYLYKRAYCQLLQQYNNQLEFLWRGEYTGKVGAMNLSLLAFYPIKDHYAVADIQAQRHFAEGLMHIANGVKNPLKTGLKSIFYGDDFMVHFERAQKTEKKTLEHLLIRLFKHGDLYDLPEKYAKKIFSHKIITEADNIVLISAVLNSKHANTYLTVDFLRHCIAVEEGSECHPEGLRELMGLQLTNLMM